MQGIAPPLVTPFTKHGDIDLDRLRSLIEEMESAGVDFLVLNGSTSEAPACTPEERASIVETALDHASIPVLVGTGQPGLPETLAETALASELGADGALIVTPYYYPHGQESLLAHYQQVADEADIPVYLYSVPKFTGITLAPETVQELAKHPNIVGMKDSSGSLSEFVRTIELLPDDGFELFVGAGGILAPALQAGAAGGVLAMANIVPSEAAAVYEAHQEGAHEQAREEGSRLVSINHAVTGRFGIPGLKWVMRQRGFSAGYSRTPFQPPRQEARQELERLLHEL